jgi:N-methylhydantoinase B
VLDADVPNNSGVFRCIKVSAPEGSILNPQLPAPVAARALTGYRVVDAMMGCLAQIAPDRVIAAGEGGNTVVCIGGYDKETREPFILVDMINGAWGARSDKDGIEGITNPSQNMSNMPVETLEARYPVRIEEYAYLPDSCGAGEHRGGVGLIRQYRLLAEEAILQLRSDRHKHKPYGLAGGGAASGNRNIMNPDRNARELPSKVTMTMLKGDVIRHEQGGGGGYGDPLLRAPERVARDIANGKISAAYASDRHGVVVEAATAMPDLPATLRLRAAMRQAAQ